MTTKGSPWNSPPRLFRIGFWICIVIAVAIVIRRVIALIFPTQSGPPQMAALDRVFASHAVLTLAHILPAMAFVIVVPFAILRRFWSLAWPERWLFPLGVVVGLTAYVMSAYSIGGRTELSAVLFYNSMFLFSLGRAWSFKTKGEPIKKRQWRLRAIGILLGVASTRPVMGVFFATSAATHLTPQQFFGAAFWIGFSINWIAVEIFLHSEETTVRHPVPDALMGPARTDPKRWLVFWQ